jgi:site-specific recombinase XerD
MGIKAIGDGRFKIDLRIGGRRGPRMRKTVEGMSAAEAKAAYRDLQASARAVGPLAAGATVRDGYIHARTVRWEGTRAIRSIEEDYGILTQFIPESTPLSQVGTTEINATIIGLRKRGLKDQTINHKLSVLRVIFKEGIKATPPMCHAVPAIPLLKPNRRLIRKPLNEQQEAEFMAYVAQRHADPAKHPREGEKWQLMQDLIVFLVDAGCRLSESLRVTERDIDLKEGMVHVWENKADKPRSQPMTPRVRAMIERRMAGRWNSPRREARLFAGKAKKTLQQAFKMVRDTLGFGPETVLHSLRHTCGTRLIQRNVDVRVVKEYMGHRRIETTMGYAHVAEAQIKEAGAILAGAALDVRINRHRMRN